MSRGSKSFAEHTVEPEDEPRESGSVFAMLSVLRDIYPRDYRRRAGLTAPTFARTARRAENFGRA